MAVLRGGVIHGWGTVSVGGVAAAGADVSDDPCPLVHQSCRRDGEAVRRRSGHSLGEMKKSHKWEVCVWWWRAPLSSSYWCN